MQSDGAEIQPVSTMRSRRDGNDSAASARIRVTVRFFAGLRDYLRCKQVELEVPRGTTLQQLVEMLVAQLPAMASIVKQIRFAVDNRYVTVDEPLYDGCEVLCFPPVSGG